MQREYCKTLFVLMYLKPFTASPSVRHNDAKLYSEDLRRWVNNAYFKYFTVKTSNANIILLVLAC